MHNAGETAQLHAGYSARDVRDSFKEIIMLYAAFVFLIISLIAGALGMTGVAAVSGGIAKLIFGFFMLLFILFLVLALFVMA